MRTLSKSLQYRARKLATLGPAGLALLAEAAIVLIRVRLALTFSSFTKIQRKLLPAAVLPVHLPAPALARMSWCVRSMARLVPGASCLTQALALQKLLHGRGVASELKLGVRRDGPGGLAAHAWVLVDGKVVIGGAAADLAPFATIAKFDTGAK